jgi:hypothetical protein
MITDRETGAVITHMTCAEYDADHFWGSRLCDQMIQEMNFEDGFSATQLFKAMLAMAAEDGITLSDADDWDYETAFWNAYRNWQL